MENNHTDIGQFRENPPRRPEQTRPAEKPKRQEKISITEWMAQTLDEMKRRVGWFKENPEVTQVKKMTREYPDLGATMEGRLKKVERKADEALREATEELKNIVESPTPIEIAPIERMIQPVSVDFNNREIWQDFKFQLIKEFGQAFGKATPREGDFEVKLSAPLSTSTLADLKERGPAPVRVRSESVGGVRMDALMSPPDTNKVSEYRIYSLDGYYKTIPGNQDPVEALIDQAKTNQITFQNWSKAAERARENRQVLRGGRTAALEKYDTSLSLPELVKQHHAVLGTAEEYAQGPEKILRVTGIKPPTGPEVGKLKYQGRPEPAVNLERNVGDWEGTEPEVGSRVDGFFESMKAKYGPEVAARLEEHVFAQQDTFDQYVRAWESATHNDTLKPEQLDFTRKVFAALKAEGKERGLGGKGSYAYMVEAYKNQEKDLPRLLENIQSVREIITDPSTPKEELSTYEKELNYLLHLKTGLENDPKQVLHQKVEQFLEQNQYLLTLGEIRQILEADQVLDTADNVEQARQTVAEAMDFPARLVLDKKITSFLKEYERFMRPGEKELFEEKKEALEKNSGPVNFWDENAEISDATSVIKRRAWNSIAVESFTRVNQAVKRFGNEMDEVAYPVVEKLRLTLQQSIPSEPGAGLNLNAMKEILGKFDPVEFEQYITNLLNAATGKDMRPDREKTVAELRPSPEAPKSDTWIQEIPPVPAEKRVGETMIPGVGETLVPERPTPVMVEEYEEEEEMEDVSAEIPGLVRALRSVQVSPEDGRLAANRAKEILEQAGSDEMIEVTQPMLQRLDDMKARNYLTEKIYRRALANLISADSFNAREQAIADLKADLPLPFMHQPGKMRAPVTGQIPQEKQPKKQEVA